MSNWVSVENSLPDYDENVLVCGYPIHPQMQGTVITIGRRFNAAGSWVKIREKNSFLNMAEVTHWMYLPEKPKG